MTKTAHTPGPWAVVNGSLISSNLDSEGQEIDRPVGNQGIYVAQTKGPDSNPNAARIVACVNACEGIANPDVVPEAIAALRGVRWRSADRDNMEFVATITYSQMDKLRAILAKLEGRS
ncbi:hypothetical protein [Blastomonas sp. CCH1-A6]|jgi:hypothetical protein|uniref:hypothetical protein n=1 Tax=Blastomonas sp. CCH1-A6 TaxID=1768762 RepID=UPI00082FD21E